jgi:hypothetical protein
MEKERGKKGGREGYRRDEKKEGEGSKKKE